jgi:hypothetical protein
MPFRAALRLLMMSSGSCPRATKGGSEQSKAAITERGAAVKPRVDRLGKV